VEKKHVQLEHEIACVDVSPLRVGLGQRAQLAAVGMWTDLSWRVFRSPTFEPCRRSPVGSIIPRSVLFCAFEEVSSPPTSPFHTPPSTTPSHHTFPIIPPPLPVDSMPMEPPLSMPMEPPFMPMEPPFMPACCHCKHCPGGASAACRCRTCCARWATAAANSVVDGSSGALRSARACCCTQPIALKPFQASTTHVFAASDHPTVIYSGNSKAALQ